MSEDALSKLSFAEVLRRVLVSVPGIYHCPDCGEVWTDADFRHCNHEVAAKELPKSALIKAASTVIHRRTRAIFVRNAALVTEPVGGDVSDLEVVRGTAEVAQCDSQPPVSMADQFMAAVGGEAGLEASLKASVENKAIREAWIESTRPAELPHDLPNPLSGCSMHVGSFAFGTVFTEDGVWCVPPGCRQWYRVGNLCIEAAQVLYKHGWNLVDHPLAERMAAGAKWCSPGELFRQ